jgi:hypothetical protein
MDSTSVCGVHTIDKPSILSCVAQSAISTQMIILLLLHFLCSRCINKCAAGLKSRQKKKGNSNFNPLLVDILCHDLLDVQILGIVNCKISVF